MVKKSLPEERMGHQTLEKGELGREVGVKSKEFQAEVQKCGKRVACPGYHTWSAERRTRGGGQAGALW